MSRLDIDSTIESMRQTGLLNHLDEAQIQLAIESVRSRDGGAEGLLYSLPEIVLGFDSEYWWDPTVAGSYEKLVRDTARISRGAFNPEKVRVTGPKNEEIEDGDTLTLSFDLGGQQFVQPLAFWGDALDLHFVDSIDSSLDQTGSTSRVFWIDTNDQMVVIVILTLEQQALVKELVGAELRPWSEFWGDSIR